jgi:hypothetical protein
VINNGMLSRHRANAKIKEIGSDTFNFRSTLRIVIEGASDSRISPQADNSFPFQLTIPKADDIVDEHGDTQPFNYLMEGPTGDLARQRGISVHGRKMGSQ